MGYVQVVSPNLSQETGAGWCLKFTQDSFRAPRMYASATDAANATKLRNSSRSMPNVAVPVWFDHWGTYQGRYANWGHVVDWVPGRGFLSSPASGFGQLWLSSIEAVERTFNAKYRFWSLDINTLQVAKEAPDSTTPFGQEEDEDMPDSMFAVVDGVPSWCWLNWSTGEIFACHTQEEADWIGGYMGSVKFDWSKDKAGGEKYKNKLAFFGMLAPKATINGGGALTPADLTQIQAHVDAGVKGALAGLTLKAVADA